MNADTHLSPRLGPRVGAAAGALVARLEQGGRHTELVFPKFVWLIRAAALIIVGTEGFHDERFGTQAQPLQFAGFAVLCLLACFWALLDLRPTIVRNPALWLTVTLGLVAVIGGLLSTPANASLFIAPAAMATMAAGNDLSELASSSVTGVAVLGIVVGSTVFDSGVGTMLGFSLALVGAYLFGRNRRGYRLQAEQAATMLLQAEQLQVQQRRADVLDERTRIAREIHDVLAHSLGGLSIQIQAARAVLTDNNDVDRALEVLSTAQRMASDGLVETRRAVHALRTDTLSLEQELRALAETHHTRYQAAVTVTVDNGSADLPPAATVALLRVAQEALINAAKHAPHQRIDISLDYPADSVRLTVANALGKDHESLPPSDLDLRTVDGGYGLTGMRERLLLLGGTLTAGRHGDQWTVVAQSPHSTSPHAAV